MALAGLLIAVAVVGVAGILINRNIHETIESALEFSVRLEDRGDDLRVAILDVRHYHRDLLLNNPSVPRIDAWQGRYEILLEEIAALDELIAQGPPDPNLPEFGQMRAMAEAYYADFPTVVDAENEADFISVAEGLLPRIDAMADIAERVDDEGERRAQAAFIEIDEASSTGTLVLVAVMVGLGAVGGVLAVAVLRLIGDQRRLVTEEQAVATQMAEASRAKTDFIADASHELRTPLTVLRGNAEIGLAMQEPGAHREIFAEIVDEAARMSRLVDDLLFLARSDASSVPLALQRIPAAELLDRVVGRAEVLAGERGASLVAEVAADGILNVDPDRIEQAVLVLVDNAAKYGPPGGVVELSAGSRGGRLVIDILDRGPGIPEDQLSRVFERFYRGAGGARDRTTGGAGLGLSIAAAIIDGHGGQVSAARRQGGGTVMSIGLPMAGSLDPGAEVER
jgi:signal transduction histidine kinase